jgi:YggT family protein
VVVSLILTAIQIYSLIIIGRMIMSFFPLAPGSPLEPVYGFLFAVTEPPLAAIRSVVPPLRLGMGALDLSPLILLIGLEILAAIIG